MKDIGIRDFAESLLSKEDKKILYEINSMDFIELDEQFDKFYSDLKDVIEDFKNSKRQ